MSEIDKFLMELGRACVLANQMNPSPMRDDTIPTDHENELLEQEFNKAINAVNTLCSNEKKVDVALMPHHVHEDEEMYTNYTNWMCFVAEFLILNENKRCGAFLEYVARTIHYEFENGAYTFTCKKTNPRDLADPLATQVLFRANLLSDILKLDYIKTKTSIYNTFQSIPIILNRDGFVNMQLSNEEEVVDKIENMMTNMHVSAFKISDQAERRTRSGRVIGRHNAV